jgi:hypothetical protein
MRDKHKRRSGIVIGFCDALVHVLLACVLPQHPASWRGVQDLIGLRAHDTMK